MMVSEQDILTYKQEVDNELHALRTLIERNEITQERMEEIVDIVLAHAIPKIKEQMLNDLKIQVGEATLEVGKRALQIIGAFVIALAIWITSKKSWPWS